MITKWLLNSGAISDEEKWLYEYTVYSTLFGLLPLFLSIFIGGLLGALFESVLMMIPFIALRKFCGGYHLRSSKTCFFSSTLLLFLFVLILSFSIENGSKLIISLFVAVSCLQIFAVSPISSENRVLDEYEYTVFKRTARIIDVVFSILYFVLLLLEKQKFAFPVGFGIMLTALLQLPVVLKTAYSKKQ